MCKLQGSVIQGSASNLNPPLMQEQEKPETSATWLYRQLILEKKYDLMNHKAVCRTAPTTPGLLKMLLQSETIQGEDELKQAN